MYCFTFELLCQKRQAENFDQSSTYINIQFTLDVKSYSPSFTFLNRLSWRKGKKCKIWWAVSGICFILFWYFKPVFNFLPIMYLLLNPYYATLNPAPAICYSHTHTYTQLRQYISKSYQQMDWSSIYTFILAWKHELGLWKVSLGDNFIKVN